MTEQMPRRTSRLSLSLLGTIVLVIAATNVPGAHADAPACRYVVTTDTALDPETTLTWQRTLDATLRTWDEAQAYCANLSLDGTGWRVPTIAELQTIVDESIAKPAIDSSVFPNTPLAPFWASIAAAPPPGGGGGGGGPPPEVQAWVVDFTVGNTYPEVLTMAFRVRCVR